WAFVALEREPGALEGLEAALPGGTRVFVQAERLEHHWAACEAGEPHEHGEGGTAPVSVPGSAPLARGKVIVQRSQDLDEFRVAWEAAIGVRPVSMSLPGLYEELGDSKQAGQEHQAWRGIEGKAPRQKARA
ncbi:MAG: hypothetical protein JRJ10_11650, partial [Deltaproteobacteria bacterium]|nr:hypothetical protein [Deltaproteobacteria bacterium]